MSTAKQRYLQEISTEWGYLATWLPSRSVELGQTGLFDGKEVAIDDNIGRHGYEFTVDTDPSATNLAYSSSGATSIGAAAGASIATGECASVEVSFSRAGSILLHAYQAREERIREIHALKVRILELDQRAEWPPNQAVIVSVVRAERATVMVAAEKGASATCQVEVGDALGNLADPSLGLQLTSSRGMHTTVASQGPLTPMYQAMILKRSLLGGTSVRRALKSPGATSADDPLSAVADNDFALCAFGA